MVTDIMLDIETLGRSPDGAIVAIGAVAFNPTNKPDVECLKPYHARCLRLFISPISALLHGTLDRNTLEWWNKQHWSVRETVFRGTLTVETALEQLNKWIKQYTFERVWARGTTFDMPILTHAYKQVKLPVPWNYREIRDSRIVDDVPGCKLPQDPVQAHDPWYDAKLQALEICAFWQKCIQIPINDYAHFSNVNL